MRLIIKDLQCIDIIFVLLNVVGKVINQLPGILDGVLTPLGTEDGINIVVVNLLLSLHFFS